MSLSPISRTKLLTACVGAILVTLVSARAWPEHNMPLDPAERAAQSGLAGSPTALDDRLAAGLPLTDAEMAAIARAKADPSALNLGELASLRHDLALSYQRAADRSGDLDPLRVAILYGASAVDLNPHERRYRTTLGGLYSRYAAFEIVAGFAALEVLGAAWSPELATTKSADKTSASGTLLQNHQHQMRIEHLARTHRGFRHQVYRSVLDRSAPDPAPGPNSELTLDGATRQLLEDELTDVAETQSNLDARHARWQARLAELGDNPEGAAAATSDNVKSELSRLETEALANRTVQARLDGILKGRAGLDGPADRASNFSEYARNPARPALIVAREILSLAPPPGAGSGPGNTGPNLPPDIAAVVTRARKARARGLVEPVDAKSLAARDLLERLSRLTAITQPSPPEEPAQTAVDGAADDEAGTTNPNAPPAPELRVVYNAHKTTRPQIDKDVKFTRTGQIGELVPAGAKLRLEGDIKIPSADPQPWIGFAWVLYDLNRVNSGRVDVGPTVEFNEKGAAQLGGQKTNEAIETTLHFDLPTAALAPGPYSAVLATFYLGDDGEFDADRALSTTALTRAPFEIVEGDIGIHIDLPDRLASPGWTTLTTITSDWAATPYTIDVTLDNLVFKDTDDETELSTTGLSPLVKFGGVMTAPDAPAEGDASVSVQITDALGRSANATRRLVIGGQARATFTPSLE